MFLKLAYMKKWALKKMDVLPSGSIFHELKVVHDTGYFDGKVSPEERWQQVSHLKNPFWVIKKLFSVPWQKLILEERKS